MAAKKDFFFIKNSKTEDKLLLEPKQDLFYRDVEVFLIVKIIDIKFMIRLTKLVQKLKKKIRRNIHFSYRLFTER